MIEQVRIAVGIFLPLFTYYCLTQYNATNDVYFFKINTAAIACHMAFDLTTHKHIRKDALFHHICVCGMVYCLFLTPAIKQMHLFHQQAYATLQVEYSTFFLTFMDFLPNLMKKYDNTMLSIAYAIVQPAFMCTFAYTRLYRFPQRLVFDTNYVEFIYTLFRPTEAWLYTFSVHGLYFLNIYWGGLILKMCMKPFKHLPPFRQLINEYIMKYTMVIPPIISIYMYVSGGNWQNVYLLDIAGTVILCHTSHNYHTMLYNQLVPIYPKTDVDVLKNENVWIYLDDICAINLRLFLSTYVFFSIRGLNGHIFVCGMTHALCMYLYIRYIFQLKLGGNTFSLEETQGTKSNIIYVLSGLPLLVDIGCGLWYMDYLSSQKIMLTYVLSILSLYLRPMYQASHLLFHCIICVQTYFMIQLVLSISS